jgi:bifunctional DNA-binding transcriptional regulator/antitoxin component of YhaV-PrlF toxin-antitoxin module
MLYSSISSAGLIAIPQQVREYLKLPSEGGIIAVKTAGKFQIRVSEPIENEMSFMRKVTKSGQFKLPAALKASWELNGKGEVSFHVQEPYVFITLAGPKIQCMPCLGSGLIYGLTCPICEGEGVTRKSPFGPQGELAEAIRHSRKYGMDISIDSSSQHVSIEFKKNSPPGYRDIVENYIKQLATSWT